MGYRQEDIKPYRQEGDKGSQVEAMFDSIAPTYDKLNHRLSWNIDKGWRRKAVRAIAEDKPKQVLDVATGTGDFALLTARMIHPERLMAVDLSEKMMAIGRKKAEAAGLGDVITFRREDCLDLSFEDGSFDAVTAAFGIRNFQDLDKGLAEMCRVLRKGGVLSIVELTSPVRFPMRQLFHVYAHTFLPLYGRLISKDASAYRYLTATIEAFPQGERMTDILRKAGFTDVSFRRLTLGICTLYTARK